MDRFLVVCCLMVSSLESCSVVEPDDGTLYISSMGLLNDDLDSVLLGISSYPLSDNARCKVMNSEDGSVGDAEDCDDYSDKVRYWSDPDSDPTNTSIISVTPSTITLQRNDESISIQQLPFNFNETLYFKDFTLNSLYTTFVIISDEEYSDSPLVIAIVFDGLNNNAYSWYQVTTNSDSYAWGNLDVAADVDNKIEVYESVQALKMPMICCLCADDFIAVYNIEIDETNNEYNMNISQVQSDGMIDTESSKAYSVGIFWSSEIDVYDFNDGTSEEFELDLSGATIYKPVFISVFVLFLLCWC